MIEQNLSVTRIPAVTLLLIDDQPIIAEAIRQMLQNEPDISFHYCQDPAKALNIAAQISPTVVLQDLVMPDIDGLLLVRYFRVNPATRDVPLIVLSTKEDPKIKGEAFALGANDYMVKLPDRIELLARVRYHSAAYTRLLERNDAYAKLEESQKTLQADLNEAADYVRSLLPPPLFEAVRTSWCYIPSALLGGDGFGYYWHDDDHFIFYLLDVCGHGVGAALLSITVLNVMRNQTLAHADFLDPKSVLKALNLSFPMEKHHNMFFTMWYGVYQKSTREIVFSCGGHPPAILFTGKSPNALEPTELRKSGLVIGAIAEAEFENGRTLVGPFNELFLFSDGVYEISQANGKMFQLEEFVAKLSNLSMAGRASVDAILAMAQDVNNSDVFQDDFSIVKLTFD